MRTGSVCRRTQGNHTRGFTLPEVTISLAIAGMMFAGVLYGYVFVSDQAEWSAYSLAAQSLAIQGVEQARAAKWDPQAWPSMDELGITNFAQACLLDVPTAPGFALYATNYVSVTAVSSYPPLRQLRTDCVWSLPYRKGRIRGPFTNSVITLRAPDQ